MDMTVHLVLFVEKMILASLTLRTKMNRLGYKTSEDMRGTDGGSAPSGTLTYEVGDGEAGASPPVASVSVYRMKAEKQNEALVMIQSCRTSAMFVGNPFLLHRGCCYRNRSPFLMTVLPWRCYVY